MTIRILTFPGFDIDRFMCRNPHIHVVRGNGDQHFDLSRPEGRQPKMQKCARCGFEIVITLREARLAGWVLKRRSNACPRCAGRP